MNEIVKVPKLRFPQFTDTWEQILAAESDGTYSSKYSVGDTKLISVNGADYYAEIAAFNKDELADGNETAKITWILSTLLNEGHIMNSALGVPWGESELRSWLNDTVLPTLPAAVKNGIKGVRKSSYNSILQEDEWTTDALWIPSKREVYADSSCETSGVVYSFGSRVKYKGSAVSYWWLRSQASSSNFYAITSTGTGTGNSPTNRNGVLLGFCT